MIKFCTEFAVLAVLAASAPAQAAVTISTAATQNMSCSSGTCVPTAAKAVLNVSDLESDLSQFGNVRVMTTGSGVEASNIDVRAAFSSPDSTSLTLEANQAITVDAAVSIGSATAELELQSDTLDATDALSFGRKGHITFGSLSDIFGINGGIFTLVGSVQGLATAVAANPNGTYALANEYDASQDGTYVNSPVATQFGGVFEGLGNTISNISVEGLRHQTAAGLFIGNSGTVKDIGLTRLMISGQAQSCGGLVGDQAHSGSIFGSHVSGKIVVGGGGNGGLVGYNIGTIEYSYSNVMVKNERGRSWGGGLVAFNAGPIAFSFATGPVSGKASSVIGGLVGENHSTVQNSYASGNLTGGDASTIGGFAGINSGNVNYSYSTGKVVGGSSSIVGGFLGKNGRVSDSYWDTTTSGTDTGVGDGSGVGVTGLTTEQLQSGLPTGFDPKVWAEDPNINNGLPYLIANPPPK